MKKRMHIWIQIIFGLILIILIYFLINKQPEITFKKVAFTEKNIVINRTKNSFLDTIVLAGLNSMKIDSVTVAVFPLTSDQIDGFELKGLIYQTKNGQYVIHVKKTNRRESIEIIAHELIHLRQYLSKELIVELNGVRYKNIFYDFEYFPDYYGRVWEKEAFDEQNKVEANIMEILYK
jgi:Zn-dependent protease with chaperone function